ncbi:MAG: gliding motility-associated C-terminal domain-containing protein, partial [Streptococcus sp.]|nr:gliding motility-associated C-terminal domain-containing protein [Streptococcus sp.]
LPEPDSFYHTSLLNYNIATCGGEITFDFTPFSYWNDGTKEASLIVLRNDQTVDTVTLSVGQTSFSYNSLLNNETYTFYVRESGNDKNTQIAFSNPITINTYFYEPIRWIVIDDLSLNAQNQATISWTTNSHNPEFLFQLSQNGETIDIPAADLINSPGTNKYSYLLPGFSLNPTEYQISLQDSCNNMIESLSKRVLLTQGQLNGSIDLDIQWTDIADTEWTVNSYDVFYKTQDSYMLLGSVDGNTTEFQYAFDENNPPDSVCYYVEAKGEILLAEADTTTDLIIRSNTVCLYGETIIQLPNAYNPGLNPYKPIIVPLSNISSYVFRVFDRYGNLIFESANPSEGWQGQYKGKDGFMDVYVVQVEVTTSQGETIEESGSLLLFP